jgi:Asp-tRNA(Asn)/Glu-tRNA(Gln) amidotransferase B subunit
MAEKYIIDLTAEERQQLISLTSKGKISSRTIKRAQILLLADEGHPDETITQMLHGARINSASHTAQMR